MQDFVLNQQERAALKRLGAELVILFGSSIDPRRKPEDVDVAVLLSEKKRERYEQDFGAYTDFWMALGKSLGVNPDKLDITFISPKTPPLLLYKIAMEGRLLFGSWRRFGALRLYAWKRYQDTAYFRKMLELNIERRIKLHV